MDTRVPEARLRSFGWNERWQGLFSQRSTPTQIPARVSIAYGSHFKIEAEAGTFGASMSGKLRHDSESAAELPTVGDWVVTQLADDHNAVIRHVLPRRTWFSRRAAGRAAVEQVVAANIDVAFLVTAMDHDFSPRRLERYLITARQRGVAPVIVLNKADACDDVAQYVREARAVADGVPVHAISSFWPSAIEELAAYLAPGVTAVLLGSSGVGKSTLINHLLGIDVLATREIRVADSKGRHTTVRRQLLQLADGGMVIDTPGLRELQLWSAPDSVSSGFTDIVELAQQCHFRDCTHQQEPGCAVRAHADTARLESYQRLQREAAYVVRQSDQLAAIEEKRRWKRIHKAMNRRVDKRDAKPD